MKRIFITGLSGTGKTSAIDALRARGFAAIDTDYGDWCELSDENGESEWIWREGRMRALLEQPLEGPLFVSGCVSNQGKFYPHFDHKVLFSAPLDAMLQRVAARTTNPYGKTSEERAEICGYYETVLPLLKKSCDLEIDTAGMGIDEVADYLAGLAG